MPAGSTYTPIATTTLGSAQVSYTFTSIPSTYTDLVLVAGIAGVNTAGSAYSIQLNGDTASNYSATALIGNGSAATSERTSNVTILQVGAQGLGSGTGVENLVISFMNYKNTTTNKTVLSRWAGAAIGTTASVGMWRNTAAITSILIQLNGTRTFNAGSTFTLYGIASA
jgi:hypothetical protein